MIRLVLVLLAIAALAGCQQSSSTTGSSSTSTSSGATSTPATTAEPAPSTPPAGPSGTNEVKLPSGLGYKDEVVGNGALAEAGRTVIVHYTGWLTDGTKFDSSKDRGQPFSFLLGSGQVIRGWDEGVKGMRVGGKRKLTIPPDMGYGSQGAGGVIPPNATLLFDVELLEVR